MSCREVAVSVAARRALAARPSHTAPAAKNARTTAKTRTVAPGARPAVTTAYPANGSSSTAGARRGPYRPSR